MMDHQLLRCLTGAWARRRCGIIKMHFCAFCSWSHRPCPLRPLLPPHRRRVKRPGGVPRPSARIAILVAREGRGVVVPSSRFDSSPDGFPAYRVNSRSSRKTRIIRMTLGNIRRATLGRVAQGTSVSFCRAGPGVRISGPAQTVPASERVTRGTHWVGEVWSA